MYFINGVGGKRLPWGVRVNYLERCLRVVALKPRTIPEIRSPGANVAYGTTSGAEVKRVILLSLLVIMVAGNGFAGDKGITGVRLGMNLLNVNGPDADNPFQTPSQDIIRDMAIGFSFSGFVTWDFSPHFAIMPELTFSRKGTRYTSGPISLDLRLEYIQLTIFPKFTFLPGSLFKPYIYGGPTYGFNISSKFRGDVQVLDQDNLFAKGSIPDRYNEFSIVAGGGFVVPLSDDSMLLFEVRYDHGFTNLSPNLQMRNQVLTLVFGWAYE